MSAGSLLLRPWYWFLGRVFATWARPAVQPADPAALLDASEAPVCYVLETGGLADTIALDNACRKHGLPLPRETLRIAGMHEPRLVVLRRLRGFLLRRRQNGSMRLKRLVEVSVAAGGRELLLVPVAIYWGRSPDKEHSWFKLLFLENWEVAGRTRKLIATIFHGRNTLLRFSEPLPISTIVQDGLDAERAYRKVSRVLRVHFRQRRAATLGPDLSHRRTLLNHVLSDPTVLRAIEAEAGAEGALRERAQQKAREYAEEIAAHVSYPTIRTIERTLSWLWNRIYDGIEFNNADRLHEVASDNELVYVPCHRSHFDYLLLGYVVYRHGLSIPHTAAGINLDMPVIGPILRRGGAFFLRRSFKGNRLYATVFNAYMHQILVRGHSIEYFVEGGRSRTGRLLPAKSGMLAMTVSSYIRAPQRPIVFVPVYFGYEKLIEGDSFISELGGAEKQKESLFGLIRSVRSLREYFGKVYVNIGEPIHLAALLDETTPDWRRETGADDERPAWLVETVDELGTLVMRRINSAAAVTPISLLASVLLATPKQTMGEMELQRQLQLSLDLLAEFRYSDEVTLPDLPPEAIIAHGEKMGVVERTAHPLGDVLHMAERQAVLMTYFRNNVHHLFAIPASIACCFIHGRQLPHEEVQRLVRLTYPFMQTELSLKWDEHDIDEVTTAGIQALIDLGILSRDAGGRTLVRPPTGSAHAFQLLMLGQSMVPMLQRFYLVVALLFRHGSGVLTRVQLENLCQQSAERLTMIYGLHSPDFFDKNLFRDFIGKLRQQDVLRRNEQGLLEFDEDLKRIGDDARLVLGEEIRHSILSLTLADTAARTS
ncbi:MAG TPA: glycerol-3-phosphate 1-O-acyltransferase PlsB [Woeseiaceae bacterium]|nr:glycerol-3-phosphate 1-O-acyltransferase PlsB [Woeseiaceae bacterium]